MNRNEAKEIIDAGVKYLITTGAQGETVALLLAAVAGYEGFQSYIVARENGAGGNLVSANGFDEAWEQFAAAGAPISQVDYYQKGPK